MSISTDAEVTETVQATDPSVTCTPTGLKISATTPDLTMRLFRSMFDERHQPTREPEEVTYKEDVVGGVPGIWAFPKGADRTKVWSTPMAAASRSGPPQATASWPATLPRQSASSPSSWITAGLPSTRTRPRSKTAWLSSRHSLKRNPPDHITTSRRLRRRQPGDRHSVGAQGAGRTASRPGHRFLTVAGHGKQGRNARHQLCDGRVDHPAAARGDDRRRPGPSVSPQNPLANPLYADFAGFPPPVHHRGLGRTPDGQRHPPEPHWPRQPAST